MMTSLTETGSRDWGQEKGEVNLNSRRARPPKGNVQQQKNLPKESTGLHG